MILIEYGKKPGLFSYYATGVSWFGVAPLLMLVTLIFVVGWRGFADVFWVDTKDPKD